jgi:hypothetical protein
VWPPQSSDLSPIDFSLRIMFLQSLPGYKNSSAMTSSIRDNAQCQQVKAWLTEFRAAIPRGVHSCDHLITSAI